MVAMAVSAQYLVYQLQAAAAAVLYLLRVKAGVPVVALAVIRVHLLLHR
jgi:hypothetical protein